MPVGVTQHEQHTDSKGLLQIDLAKALKTQHIVLVVSTGYIGAHHVSRKYLPLYLRELSYRYNLRQVGCDLDGLLHLAVKPQSA